VENEGKTKKDWPTSPEKGLQTEIQIEYHKDDIGKTEGTVSARLQQQKRKERIDIF